jgi:hypothetical protein
LYLSTFDIVRSFGPTPLNELTSRVSGEPEQVAQEINKLTAEGLLEVVDEKGHPIGNITPEQARSSSSRVQLTPKSIKLAFAS